MATLEEIQEIQEIQDATPTNMILQGCGMETFRGQWHLVDTIFQNGWLLVDILKGWLFVDTFDDISWTILVKETLFSAKLG